MGAVSRGQKHLHKGLRHSSHPVFPLEGVGGPDWSSLAGSPGSRRCSRAVPGSRARGGEGAPGQDGEPCTQCKSSSCFVLWTSFRALGIVMGSHCPRSWGVWLCPGVGYLQESKSSALLEDAGMSQCLRVSRDGDKGSRGAGAFTAWPPFVWPRGEGVNSSEGRRRCYCCHVDSRDLEGRSPAPGSGLSPGPPNALPARWGWLEAQRAAWRGCPCFSWTLSNASLLGTSAQPVAWGPPGAWPQGLSSQEETAAPKTPIGLVLCRWVSSLPPEAPWWSPGHSEAGITGD